MTATTTASAAADPAPGSEVGRVRRPQHTRSRYSLVCLVVTALSVVGLLPGSPTWLAAFTMIAFIGLGPGCAILAWLERPPPISRLMLVPGYGLATLIIVSAAAATVGWWSPHGLYAMIALGVIWSVIPNLGSIVRDLVP